MISTPARCAAFSTYELSSSSSKKIWFGGGPGAGAGAGSVGMFVGRGGSVALQDGDVLHFGRPDTFPFIVFHLPNSAGGTPSAAWSCTATYLSGRIQSADHERPGRKPDMTPQAAEMMRAVLQEIWWESWEILRMRRR